MSLQKEDQSRGGRSASQKVYYCKECGGIGSGNRMVSDHLDGDCKGLQGRKLKISTEANSHRLEEAIINSAEWEANKVLSTTRLAMREQADSVAAHILQLRSITSEFMPEAFESYYKNIF